MLLNFTVELSLAYGQRLILLLILKVLLFLKTIFFGSQIWKVLL